MILGIGMFLGRFHPVIIHLPIGFLLLAVLLEFYSRKRRNQKLDAAISFSLFWGFVSGIMAVLLGFLLSSEGGYDYQLLNWHRISGISVTVIALICWLLKSKRIVGPEIIYLSLTGLLFLTIVVTGHIGGMLTHGSDYFTDNAPGFIRKILFAGNEKADPELPVNPDSVIVYSDLIQPMLKRHCKTCHNPVKKSSGLVIDSWDHLMKGGEGGEVIIAGHSIQSELIKRVTLPQTDHKFMPPKGKPLSYGEIQLLRWWIDTGASLSGRLNDPEIPEDIFYVLTGEFNYDPSPRSYVEMFPVTAPEEKDLKLLKNNHFGYRFLSGSSNYLDVRYIGDSIHKENIEALLAVSNQVTWLDLRNSSLKNDMLKTVGKLSNLTRLRLDGNPVTEKGIVFLEDLEHLEQLSLYRSATGPGCLKTIQKLRGLEKIYLGHTQVAEKDLEQIRKVKPELDIVLDLHFKEFIKQD